MGQQLSGKVAIVTGGAGGLGRATVERFVAEGARVVVADTDAVRGEEIAAGLGTAAAFRRTDVSRADDVQACVDFAVEHFGGLDVMFNNAGISGSSNRFLDDDLSGFSEVLGVNLFGVMAGSQRAARHMAAHGGGSIINTTSIAGINAGAGLMTYRVVEGRHHPLHPIDRDRPRRARDPGQLHRAGPHPDRDQHQLRRRHDRAADAAAAAGGQSGRRGRRRPLPRERAGRADHRDRAADRRRDDGRTSCRPAAGAHRRPPRRPRHGRLR